MRELDLLHRLEQGTPAAKGRQLSEVDSVKPIRGVSTPLLSLLLVAVHVSGCATTINGRSQKLLIATDPAGAVIRVDGVRVHDTHAPELSRSH